MCGNLKEINYLYYTKANYSSTFQREQIPNKGRDKCEQRLQIFVLFVFFECRKKELKLYQSKEEFPIFLRNQPQGEQKCAEKGE